MDGDKNKRKSTAVTAGEECWAVIHHKGDRSLDNLHHESNEKDTVTITIINVMKIIMPFVISARKRLLLSHSGGFFWSPACKSINE